jgi:ComF family protein
MRGLGFSTLVAAGRALADMVFGESTSCPVCGRVSRPGELCRACVARIPVVTPPVCRICGVPLRLEGAKRGECVVCARGGRYFKLARAAAIYEGAARDYVHDLKYRGKVELAAPLGRLMAICAGRARGALACDAVVPVPLHPAKVLRRGYNQAELLAYEVGKALGVPAQPECLVRTVDTPAQAGLERDARRRNALRAFQAGVPARVAGRSVLLIDDVLTSGGTADGCARALLRVGAKDVVVVTFAVSVADGRDWLSR